MKRYSTIMSVLLTLALPVAGSCADAPKAAEKTDTTVGATKAPAKAETGTEAAKVPAKADTKAEAPVDPAKVEAIKDSMSKGKHSMMGGTAPEATANPNPAGKVAETMEGGGYTYARLEKDGKSTWVAYSSLETHVGDTLTFKGCMEMPNFESKVLKRKFDAVMFCGAPEVKKVERKSPGSTGAVATAKGKISVDKATGANAYTVGEVFSKRAALHGKQVVVRGQVVKTASGIMNKNWIHLQDGTGSAKDKSNDLVVTSDQLPADGDVITISGTVAKDKDFGSGYKYKVILEKGIIKK